MIHKSLKSSAHLAQQMLGKSEAQKTAEAIREEIIQTVQDPDFSGSINKYIRRLQPEPFDWKKARQELTKLLSGLEVKANVRDGEGGLERETFIRLAQKHFNKEDAQKFGEIFEEVKSAGKAGGGAQEKVMAVVEKLAPGSREDIEQVKEKVIHYLQSTGVDALNPESLKEDLNNIIAHPQSAKSVVLNRIKQFDHSTLESIVSKTGNIPNEQKSKIVNRIETVLHTIEDKLEHPGGDGEGKNIKSTIEDKVRNYFASLQRPEFDYEQIKMDFERMFHDPKAALEILKNRLKQFNRESFVALLSSQPHISSEKAEKIVAKIEEARENTIRKAEEIDRKVKEKLQEAKETALHQAENVRRNIAVASWWIFASAVISAGASALGGILAL